RVSGDLSNLQGVEEIDGGDGWNQVVGTSSDDTLDFTANDAPTLENIDRINAGAGNDTIINDDTGREIYGDRGNDTLVGGAGDDVIDGGRDQDTVVFSGNRSDYEITEYNETYTIRDLRDAGDGTDTVTTVESFQFADVTLTTGNLMDASADGVNLAPDVSRGDEDTAISLDINASLNDTDGSESLSVVISGVPEDASFSAGTDNGDGSWTLTSADLDGLLITPPANSTADFTLSITATGTESVGGGTASKSESLSVTVDSVNDRVSIVSDADVSANTVAENAADGTSVGITASASDVDGDSISFSIVDAEGNPVTNGPFSVDAETGEVTVRDGSQLDYESDTSHNIQVKATSEDGTSSVQSFTVNVSDIEENQVPVAADDSAAGGAGSSLISETFDSGVSGWGDDVSASGGKMVIGQDESASKTFDFGADHANQTVVVEFDMVASETDDRNDGWETSGHLQDYFTVTLNGQQVANDSYGDGDTNDISHHYSFTAQTDGQGRLTLQMDVDTTGDSEQASIDGLVIKAGDDWSSAFTTEEETALTLQSSDLLDNDTDVDGDSLTIASAQDASHGTVSIDSDGEITFTPDADYTGEASFNYTVSDGQGGTDTASVSLNVVAADKVDAPSISLNIGEPELVRAESGSELEIDRLASLEGLDHTHDVASDPTSSHRGDLKTQLDTGAGDDSVDINGSTKSRVNLGDGNDRLDIQKDAGSVASAGEGDDVVHIGGDAKSVVDLGSGNNTLDIDKDAKSAIYMGSGDDSIKIGGDIKSSVDLKGGDDRLDVDKDAKGSVYAGDGNDQVSIGGDAKGVVGLGDGNDQLEISKDAKGNIDAGSGDDAVSVGKDAKGAVYLKDGDDQLDIGHDAKGAISGGSGSDEIRIGNNAKQNVDLGSGDDKLWIGDNAERNIYAGDGNDQIHIEDDLKGSASLGSGNDELHVGDDVSGRIYADAGNDVVTIDGEIKSYVNGGSGNDALILNEYSKSDYDSNKDGIKSNISNFEAIKFKDGQVIGDSSLFGREAGDSYSYDLNLNIGNSDASVESITLSGLPSGASLSAGTDNGDGSWALTEGQLDGLHLLVSDGVDIDFDLQARVDFAQNGQTQTVTIRENVDVINADGDTIYGTSGNDSIGVDSHSRDSHSSHHSHDSQGADEALVATVGDDQIAAGGGNDRVKAGDGDDVVFGEAGNDDLKGGKGADQLFGGEGNDKLKGEDGSDILKGGAGDDELKGGKGDDQLYGGAGDDVIEGEAGDDTYFFNPFDGNDELHGGQGGGWTDTIHLNAEADPSADPDSPWTIEVDGQQLDYDMAAHALELNPDTAGVVTLADGSELTFDGIEKIEW
ncbi:MAG: cadherin-like domain-containing protein, partial [gamma proteobacterium endosymbiont of Lamellibrachia anaximandri]|nr:cadherin-like domain-containing protein [gamma proteobacterium endosymbiont of Lamellibrachia anaximandri]